MNKKLFTLMTLGLLAAGSAFNGVNAQTYEAANKTALDGTKKYFIGTRGDLVGRVYLGGQEITLTNASYEGAKVTGPIASTAIAEKVSELGVGDAIKKYLWTITKGTNADGTFYYTFTNEETKGKLVFADDGTKLTAEVAAGQSLKLTGFSWGAVNDDGTYKANAGAGNGKITVKADTKKIKIVGGTADTDENGVDLVLYAVDNENAKPENMGVFALSFPSVDPQPETNVFDQKMKAFYFRDDNIAPKEGTYLATSWPADGEINSTGEFNASTFIAVSPTKNFGINGLKQSDGVGFDFVEVSGKSLLDETEKEQINVNNAIFDIYYADPINKEGQFTLHLREVYVKLDASKDAHSKVTDVYVDAFTSTGVTYVTTSSKATAQKLTLSESNKVKIADILDEENPAVFNIKFISNKSNVNGANSSEYGKFLGIRQNAGATAYGFFAEAESYVDLNAAQNQWVVANVNGTTITFANREKEDAAFNVTLFKTEKDDEFELEGAAETTFTWGYMKSSADGYVASTPAKTFDAGDLKVKLIPATIDKAAGFVDYSKTELSYPAKIKFTVKNNTYGVISNYVTTENGTGLTVKDKAASALQWTIVKNEAAADSVKGVMEYAYQRTIGKEVKAKKATVEDKAITTYKFITEYDGGKYYLNNTFGLTAYTGDADNFVIRKNVNGTLSIVPADDADYSEVFKNNTKALSLEGVTVKGNAAVVANLTNNEFLFPTIEIADVTPSLEPVSRHASFEGVNGGFLAVGAGNQAIVAAAVEEAANLTFWLDTADVDLATPSFFISQSPSVLKAGTARNFLWNPADSASYFNEKTASYVDDPKYYHNGNVENPVKAMFKQATLIDKNTLTTTVNGKSVKVTEDNGLENYKFQIVLADEDVEDEYVIRSAADYSYLSSINGKLVLSVESEPLVVKLGEGDATANEAIEATGVQVIGGQGAVTVQGAAGKVITVANILGQTIANQVAASDNVTIAAPAGIVVVAVEGEATKVVVK
ncbi:hypothetical protein JQM84_07645 [Parabacteroides distasonis]|nr:hypothetical protein [Parabacteroides distasonis]